MIEKSCFHCAFGGCIIEKDNLFNCNNKNVKDKKTSDKFRGEWVLGDKGNECEEFIPNVEIENEDIECYMVVNIHHKCPYCDYESAEYDEDDMGRKIIECNNCGKKYEICWSVE